MKRGDCPIHPQEFIAVTRCASCEQDIKAENSRLRTALKAAPSPRRYDLFEWMDEFTMWYDSPRAEALKKVKEK